MSNKPQNVIRHEHFFPEGRDPNSEADDIKRIDLCVLDDGTCAIWDVELDKVVLRSQITPYEEVRKTAIWYTKKRFGSVSCLRHWAVATIGTLNGETRQGLIIKSASTEAEAKQKVLKLWETLPGEKITTIAVEVNVEELLPNTKGG